MRKGVVRKAEFSQGGFTVSECVDMRPGNFLKFRQLESAKTGLSLSGSDGKLPEMSIQIEVRPSPDHARRGVARRGVANSLLALTNFEGVALPYSTLLYLTLPYLTLPYSDWLWR